VFLFSGGHGSGKTTTARIMAAMLNCENGPTMEPCGKCSICEKISSEISMDVIEIDAATNRGIDDVRSIIENTRYSPVETRSKVIILDECHQLTKAASNSLLKLLEKPSDNLYFFFCTTEPRDIIPTIKSRCQEFEFKKLKPTLIFGYLKNICNAEGIEYDEDAIRLISKISGGSVRDALKNLEALKNFSKGKLTEKDGYDFFGVPDASFGYSLMDKIIDRKVAEGIILINKAIAEGADVTSMIKDICSHIRDLAVLRSCKDSSLVDLTGNSLEKITDQSSKIKVSLLLEVNKIFEKALSATVFNLSSQNLLEMSFIEAIVICIKDDIRSSKK
jgi:DNA polymerase-3 subunit gamma/tau